MGNNIEYGNVQPEPIRRNNVRQMREEREARERCQNRLHDQEMSKEYQFLFMSGSNISYEDYTNDFRVILGLIKRKRGDCSLVLNNINNIENLNFNSIDRISKIYVRLPHDSLSSSDVCKCVDTIGNCEGVERLFIYPFTHPIDNYYGANLVQLNINDLLDVISGNMSLMYLFIKADIGENNDEFIDQIKKRTLIQTAKFNDLTINSHHFPLHERDLTKTLKSKTKSAMKR